MGTTRSYFFTKWEYWPSFMFYVPNLPYAIYLALRARSLVFYTAANPALPFSGNGSESKYDILKLIPKYARPKSVLIESLTDPDEGVALTTKAGLHYPIIVKPDIGFRGLLVKKIQDEDALKAYINQYNEIDIIAQEFIDLPNEMGVFFHRIPGENEGQVTSITLKQYPQVIGNGRSTVSELIMNNPRLRHYAELLIAQQGEHGDHVVPQGKSHTLSEIGNHSKGTRFVNGNNLINSELNGMLTPFFNEIPGWYYGRLDIKYESYENLLKGENFKVIELNGIISEPTHIYDAQHMTYLKALKQIRVHWKYLFRIARANHIQNKVAFAPVGAFLKSLKKIRKHIRIIKSLHKLHP
jgi:hypothetical protein